MAAWTLGCRQLPPLSAAQLVPWQLLVGKEKDDTCLPKVKVSPRFSGLHVARWEGVQRTVPTLSARLCPAAFLDVKGFTRLTGVLAAYPNGAELISTTINDYFTALLKHLDAGVPQLSPECKVVSKKTQKYNFIFPKYFL